jgi:hypothetical protein
MWLALLLLPVACAFLYLNDPADGGLYPPCPFKALTGLDCPGCGTTRAMHALLHGRVGTAFDLNVLAVLFLPVAVYSGAVYVARTLFDRTLPTPRIPSWAPWASAAVLGVWFVVRNLPFGPLQWLASSR